MAPEGVAPGEFGATFQRFMEAMLAEAGPPASAFLDRLRAHPAGDPTSLPVIAEEFDPFEHPNLQVALDAYVGSSGRQSDLVGVAAENKRFMGLTLSDLLSRSRAGPGRPPLAEGPVDYVSFHQPSPRSGAATWSSPPASWSGSSATRPPADAGPGPGVHPARCRQRVSRPQAPGRAG